MHIHNNLFKYGFYDFESSKMSLLRPETALIVPCCSCVDNIGEGKYYAIYGSN